MGWQRVSLRALTFDLETLGNGGIWGIILFFRSSLRVSALLSAPRCDTTQLLFIPIRLAPIWVMHSGYADPRPRPKCTPQCLLGRRTRKYGVFRLLSCFRVSFSYFVYLIMELVACFFG